MQLSDSQQSISIFPGFHKQKKEASKDSADAAIKL
jgi:hypothetical protein